MNIDHVVLWVDDPARSLEFYVDVVGLQPLRAQEFEQGKASFPSVRVNDSTIFDLMSAKAAPAVREFTGGANAGGMPLNHVCLSMTAAQYFAVASRLEDRGVALTSAGNNAFGAQGIAEKSTYFSDPDGNVIEFRYYDEG